MPAPEIDLTSGGFVFFQLPSQPVEVDFPSRFTPLNWGQSSAPKNGIPDSVVASWEITNSVMIDSLRMPKVKCLLDKDCIDECPVFTC